MEKVYIIIPDNNKGKYITNGYASAFKDLSYFLYQRKIFDLNIEEFNKLSPHIVFCFWSDVQQNDTIIDFYNGIDVSNKVCLHFAEKLSDIPAEFIDKSGHFCFSADSKVKKFSLTPCIEAKEYKSKFQGYKYSITFAGNPAYKNREEIIARLIYNFGPINIFCRSYDFYKSFEDIEKAKLLSKEFLELYKVSYMGYVENQRELAEIYSSSKINLDLENPKKKQINYRSLEILAAGGFLIAQYSKPLVRQFDEGKEIETFTNADDLTDKINFYKKNLNIAQMIALKGKRNAITNHSYKDGLKKVLKVVYGKDISSR